MRIFGDRPVLRLELRLTETADWGRDQARDVGDIPWPTLLCQSSVMDATLVTAISTVSGTAVGALVSYAAAARQARGSITSTRLQAEAQLALARHQLAITQSDEGDRARRVRLEESYRELAAWLDDLDTAVERAVALVYDDRPEASEELRLLCGDWPFEVLIPPKSASFARCFWSEQVDKLLAEFSGTSGSFTGAAVTMRKEREQKADAASSSTAGGKSIRSASRQQLWEGRGSLKSTTARIRQQIQDEIYSSQDRAIPDL